jgi:uncharacterized repeat protein (TIGR01451 family)
MIKNGVNSAMMFMVSPLTHLFCCRTEAQLQMHTLKHAQSFRRRAPIYVVLALFLLTLGIGSVNACQCSNTVTGTKTVSGTPEEGGTVTYTITLTHSGFLDQQNNAGDEFVDQLVSELTLVSASATSGTAVANVKTNTVTWNGSIPSSTSVTITITATINAGTSGQTISNQGTINYDVEDNGSNESSGVTDDPGTISPDDPTSFTVGAAMPVPQLLAPPPSPLCEDQNFDENAVAHSSLSDAFGNAVNCRVLYQNGAPVQWRGGGYSSASIGIPGIVELGIQQAVDIFSPSGQTYFEGGAVFCLRGEGTLIWLAAKNQPRHAEIIGSYTVPEFEGFTCATLFEPGTLVLVTNNPLG